MNAHHNQNRSRLRRLTLALLLAGLALLATEMTAHAGLFALRQVLGIRVLRGRDFMQRQSTALRLVLQGGERREMLDSALGWRYRPGFARGRDVINEQGVRSLRVYEPAAADTVIRIAAFGDSFVYGEEVGTREAWPSQMEALDPSLEVLNYGVGGYGVDQAFLRYRREVGRFQPQYVIMGFVPDDLRRLVSVYRGFMAPHELPFTKPRFVLSGDSLVLLPAPLRDTADYRRLADHPRSVAELGKHDQMYRPEMYENPLYDRSATVRLVTTVWRQARNRMRNDDRIYDGDVFNRSSTAFRVQLRLFALFDREVRNAGAHPLILFFPDRPSLTRIQRGDRAPYAPLVEEVNRIGIDVVDLASAWPAPLDSAGVSALFAPWGHYSARGNAQVAATVASAIRARATANEAKRASGTSRSGPQQTGRGARPGTEN
jgi:hypothetical protein